MRLQILYFITFIAFVTATKNNDASRREIYDHRGPNGGKINDDLEHWSPSHGLDDEDGEFGSGFHYKEDNRVTVNKEEDNKYYSLYDEVVVMDPETEERQTSFFAQPGILAAVVGGAVVGLLCAILVVMFIVYRMRKKDEGSYPLEDNKMPPAANACVKGSNTEFFA